MTSAAHAARAALVQRRHGERRSAIGKNGPGKSTQLNAVAGQLTQLVLARILPAPRNFLVLDEPTDYVDSSTNKTLIEALRDCGDPLLSGSRSRAVFGRLSHRVLESGGESGTEPQRHVYLGLRVESMNRTWHEAPGMHA